MNGYNDPQKPSWQTGEFWGVFVGVIVQCLIALRVIKTSDAEIWTATLTNAAVAIGVIVGTGVMIWKLIQSRTAVKVASIQAAAPPLTKPDDVPILEVKKKPSSSSLPAVLAFLLLLPATASAQYQQAVVRVTSHGGSGSVVHTEPGKTYILSAGHLFEPHCGQDMRSKPITIDVPWTTQAKPARITLMAVDYQSDLSLIRVDDGPWPCSVAVPSQAYRPGALVSAGYDGMQGLTYVPTHLCTTFTRERPTEGRSGGGLIDARGQLCGVCSGYECRHNGRAFPGSRGIYVDQEAIRSFLARQGWRAAAIGAPMPSPVGSAGSASPEQPRRQIPSGGLPPCRH